MSATVTPVYNPTRNALHDIAQVVYVNKTNSPDSTTRVLVGEIRRQLNGLSWGTTLPVVGHSQGAAIVSSAIAQTPLYERKQIDVITVGGAACTMPNGLHSISAYINTRDIVPLAAGMAPSACQKALVKQSKQGTSVRIVDYSFGNFTPDTSHGLDDYQLAASTQPGATSAAASELRAGLKTIKAAARKLLTDALIWNVIGGLR